MKPADVAYHARVPPPQLRQGEVTTMEQYQPQVTTDEFFARMNSLYPEQSNRVLADLRAEKAEAHIRALEAKLTEQSDGAPIDEGSEA